MRRGPATLDPTAVTASPDTTYKAMHWFQSNDSELLASLCAQMVSQAQEDPFLRELVLVQRPGMDRWLAQMVAGTRAIAWDFQSLPLRKLWIELAHCASINDYWLQWSAPARLRFAIRECLEHLDERSLWEVVRPHAQDSRRAMAFAGEQAKIYEEYLDRRPTLLQEWEKGAQADLWQAELWRCCLQRARAAQSELIDLAGPIQTRRAILEWLALAESEALGQQLRQKLAPRVHFFMWSNLPPAALELMEALGQQVELYLYQFVPTPHYLEDLQEQHPLVHAWSAGYRKFSMAMEQVLEGRVTADNTSIYPIQRSLEITDLTRVQESIARIQCDKLELEGDDSIQVHGCWGPLREIEALHAQISRALLEYPDWSYEDIFVWVSDLSSYAPLIDAVFGTCRPPQGPAIPYRIVDAHQGPLLPTVQGLLGYFHSFSERASLTQLLELMRQRCVAEHYGWGLDSLEELAKGLDDAQIRWGYNADARRAQGQPEEGANSWQEGLDRWLVGCAYQRSPWADAELPVLCDALSPFVGSARIEREQLGQLSLFLERYFSWRRRAQADLSLEQWGELCLEILHQGLDRSNDAGGEVSVEIVVSKLAQDERQSGAEPGRYPLAAWLDLSEDAFAAGARAAPWGRGGVSFAQLGSARPVPSEMVVLLGMGEGQFPRQRAEASWSLVQQAPFAYESNSRDEDRTAMMESLLSARSRWLAFYSSRDPQSVAHWAASPLLAELQAFVSRQQIEGAKSIFVQHPLNDYRPEAWAHEDPRLSIYRQDAWGSARVWAERGDAPARAPAIIHQPLAPPEQESYALRDLQAYFRRASAHFFVNGLGARNQEPQERFESREPSVLDGLSRFQVAQRWLQGALRGESAAQIEGRLRAEQALPWGEGGRAALRIIASQLQPLVDAIAHTWGTLPRGTELTRWTGTRRWGPMNLQGRVQSLSDAADLLVVHGASLDAKRQLSAWIDHLFVNADAKGAPQVASCIYGMNKKKGSGIVESWRWPGMEPAQAKDRLRQLLEIYRLGHRWPLPVFLEPGLRYVQSLQKGKEHPQALRDAQAKFTNSFGAVAAPCEQDWPTKRLFRPDRALGESPAQQAFEEAWPDFLDGAPSDFCALAQAIWQPLLAQRTELT